MKNIPTAAVEVCAYSFFSCLAAHRAEANRVELCASPWEGGTTPSIGLVNLALQQTSPEIHVMVRPRGGDFCYDASEKDTMEADAVSLVKAGVHGLVIGALKSNGDIDFDFIERIKRAVGVISLTFHRAIDVSVDPLAVMDALIDLQFKRILTSGQHDKAIDGIENIANMVARADGRIEIMAGSGVNSDNCLVFLDVGVHAVHLSARTTRNSEMDYRRPGISMGGIYSISEFEIAYASEALIRQTIQKIRSF